MHWTAISHRPAVSIVMTLPPPPTRCRRQRWSVGRLQDLLSAVSRYGDSHLPSSATSFSGVTRTSGPLDKHPSRALPSISLASLPFSSLHSPFFPSPSHLSPPLQVLPFPVLSLLILNPFLPISSLPYPLKWLGDLGRAIAPPGGAKRIFVQLTAQNLQIC